MSIIEAPGIPEEILVLTEREARLLKAGRHLRNAERYMVEHGWGRGRVRQPDTGRVCILGALLYGNTWEFGLDDQACVALYEATGGDPAGWNDNACGNIDEALGKLREARDLLAPKPR